MAKSRILTEEPPEWVEKVWRKNASQIYKLCQTQSNDDDNAKDLFQEVALRLCRSAGTLDLKKPIYPWLRTVVHNTFFDMNRRMLPVIPFSQLSDVYVPYDVTDKKDAVQELRERRKWLFVRHELDYLMEDLTAAERMAVEIHCVGEIRVADACLYCGVNLGTFLSRKKVALRKMRKKKDIYISKFKNSESSCLKLDDLLTRASEFS
jgi:RNA polymerase sigma factor (sigma-70 family)